MDAIQPRNAADDALDSVDAAGGDNVLNGTDAAESICESSGADAAGGAECAVAGGSCDDGGGAGKQLRDVADDTDAAGGASECAVAVAVEANLRRGSSRRVASG